MHFCRLILIIKQLENFRFGTTQSKSAKGIQSFDKYIGNIIQILKSIKYENSWM